MSRLLLVQVTVRGRHVTQTQLERAGKTENVCRINQTAAGKYKKKLNLERTVSGASQGSLKFGSGVTSWFSEAGFLAADMPEGPTPTQVEAL